MRISPNGASLLERRDFSPAPKRPSPPAVQGRRGGGGEVNRIYRVAAIVTFCARPVAKYGRIPNRIVPTAQMITAAFSVRVVVAVASPGSRYILTTTRR